MSTGTWYKLVIEPLAPPVFRRPGVFEPGETGPLMASSTYTYPEPSTIAGALARIGYETGGPCRLHGRFGDLTECLERVLGKGYELVPGFAEVGGKLHVNAERLLLPLEKLSEYAASLCGAGEALEKEGPAGFRLLTGTYTGIGLQRSSKSVSEGLIYTMEQAYPLAQTVGSPQKTRVFERVKYIVYARTGKAGLDLKEEMDARRTLKLGGEMRMVKVTAQEVQADKELPWNSLPHPTREGKDNALYLATPALIEAQTLKGQSVLTGIIEASQETSRRLAEILTKTPQAKLVTNERIEATYPGWTSHSKHYRTPALRIPPGTVICQTQSDKRRLTWIGVGKEAGYGAAIKT